MNKIGKIMMSAMVMACTPALAFQELQQHAASKYGENSQLYWRTMLISGQFAKEARERLAEISQPVHDAQPQTVITFSNVDCAVDDNDYMAACTYVFTSYQRQYDEKGHVMGVENKHTYCAVPMSIDFKFAVNYTYEQVYMPAIKNGQQPHLLDYPPAGDPTKKAITYLQECLTA